MQKPPQWILRNIARRPVELHQPSGQVVVIPSSGSIEVAELDTLHETLVRRGVLTSHRIPQSATEAVVEATARIMPGASGAPDIQDAPVLPANKAAAKRQPNAKTTQPAPDQSPTSNSDLSAGADE